MYIPIFPGLDGGCVSKTAILFPMAVIPTICVYSAEKTTSLTIFLGWFAYRPSSCIVCTP